MLGHESVRVFVITRQRTTGRNKYEPIREKLKKKTRISQLERCAAQTANVQREIRLKQPLPKHPNTHKRLLSGRPTQLKQEVESKLHKTDLMIFAGPKEISLKHAPDF